MQYKSRQKIITDISSDGMMREIETETLLREEFRPTKGLRKCQISLDELCKGFKESKVISPYLR
jgi:hypothetical protein